MDHSIEEILEYALKITQKIERPVSRTSVLLDIASVWCDAGQVFRCREILDLAVKNVDSIKRSDEKADLLVHIAGISAEADDEAKAKDLLKRAVLLGRAAETSRQKINVLHTAGLVSAESGLKDVAIQILSELYQTVMSGEKADDVVTDLVDIADICYVLDQKEKAGIILAESQSKAAEIKDDWLRLERLLDIIEELIFTGLTETAVQILDGNLMNFSSAEVNRPYFAIKISGFYKSIGEKSKAREILKQALEVIKQDELAYSRSHDLIEIALQYLQLGEISKASDLINQAKSLILTIEDTKDRVEGLIQLSAILGKAGDIEEALEAANQAAELCKTIGDVRSRIYLLGKVLVYYVDMKNQAKTGDILSEIIQITQGRKLHSGGLSSIVEELVETGGLTPGLRLTCLIKEPEAKIRALTAITQKLIDLKSDLSNELGQAIHACIEPNGL